MNGPSCVHVWEATDMPICADIECFTNKIHHDIAPAQHFVTLCWQFYNCRIQHTNGCHTLGFHKVIFPNAAYTYNAYHINIIPKFQPVFRILRLNSFEKTTHLTAHYLRQTRWTATRKAFIIYMLSLWLLYNMINQICSFPMVYRVFLT